jgi:hypothetical protein
MVLNNSYKIKKYVIISFIMLSIYFLMNSLIYNESVFIILPIYIGFIFKSYSAFIIGSLDIDSKELYNAFLKISVINFLAIAAFPFVDFLDSMNYMRFGYAMLPSVIMFIYAILKKEKNKIIWILLGIVAFFLMVVYGSRGPLVVILIWALIQFLFNRKISTYKKAIILILVSLMTFLVFKYNFIVKIVDYIYYELGIHTYTLAKLRMTFDVGLVEASSGRDIIYITMWDYIKQNPLLGYGIGFSQEVLNYTPHNLFLQILLESGVVGLLIWSVILTYCLYKYKDMHIKEEGLFNVIALVFSIAIGRLLVSSDMWLRPEYWLALSMLLNFRLKNK